MSSGGDVDDVVEQRRPPRIARTANALAGPMIGEARRRRRAQTGAVVGV